jgi:hypothetical protein
MRSIIREKKDRVNIGDLESMGMDNRGGFHPSVFFAKRTGHSGLVYNYVEPALFKTLWTKPTTNGIIYRNDLIDMLNEHPDYMVVSLHQNTVDMRSLLDDEELGYYGSIREYNQIWFYDTLNRMVLGLVYNDKGCSHTTFFCLKSETHVDYIKTVEDYKLSEEEFVKDQIPKVFILESNQLEGLFKTPFGLSEIDVDLDMNYNEDILDMDNNMERFINNKETGNGLCLLHGDPSGGKTSYIKHLIQTYPATPFVFIAPSMVTAFASPEFTSFLRSNKGAIMIIEDAESILRKREDGERNDCVANLLQMTDGLLSDAYNLKIIATFNTGLKHIDEALTRKGRLHVEYKFGKLSLSKSKLKAKELGIDEDLITDPMMLGEIYNFLKENGVKKVEKRKIGFN